MSRRVSIGAKLMNWRVIIKRFCHFYTKVEYLELVEALNNQDAFYFLSSNSNTLINNTDTTLFNTINN